MSHNYNEARKQIAERRREQRRHLVRSVGVQLDGAEAVPFFVEQQPGRFRRNPALKNVEVTDEQLTTLTVAAEVPANIPPAGLPVPAMRQLIDLGLKSGDDL